MLEHSDQNSSGLYGPAYFSSHCGPVPYVRNDYWLGFFGNIADVIVRSFAPGRVFDAGCAIGMLVECLWDRGVEAHGRDISEWAVSQARADIRPWCQIGSLAEPIDGQYDLITCIEVLEHIAEDDALRAIASLAASAPRILFSSTPTDLDEPTHVNVRPPSYWLSRWAEAGFAPSVTHDAGYIAPHAYLLERSEEGRSARDIVAFADRIRHRVALAQTGAALASARTALAESERGRGTLQAALATSMKQAAESRGTSEAEAARAGRELARREAADRHLARAEGEVDALRGLLQAAHRELRSAQAELGPARRQSDAALAQADAQTRALLSDIDLANARAQAAQRHLDIILASTSWRIGRTLAGAGQAVPLSLRRAVRRLLRLVWWTVTLQLGRRLRARAAGGAGAARIAASPFFDAEWYLGRNGDVVTSGLAAASHYARFGGREGRDPGPRFSVTQYLARHPEAASEPAGAFFHALVHGQEGDGAPALPAPVPVPRLQAPAADVDTVDQLLAARFPDQTALPVFSVPDTGNRRLTVVTDSIGGGSLYGGVGTSLILAALAARRLGAELRLVTRSERADPARVAELLKANNVPWDASIETLHAPCGGLADADVPVSSRDIFLTTSWWTTWSTRQSVAAAQIACLVQEDERMFYPLGDDYLRCAETLSDPSLTCLVNSQLLLDYFQADGLMAGATAFEPSFPRNLYFMEDEAGSAAPRRRSFFFYARPHNTRNLYWRGLEAVAAAIDEGVLIPDEWDIYFAGHGGTEVALPKGVRPIIPGPMAWVDYAAFIRRVDVGLSLMYTPHPSYPPIDIAASGGIAVTNRFGPKRDLDRYSPNILCADLDVPSLVHALRTATRLAADREARTANFRRSVLQRDWSVSMSPAVDRLMLLAGS
jgi:hypothetical protein